MRERLKRTHIMTKDGAVPVEEALEIEVPKGTAPSRGYQTGRKSAKRNRKSGHFPY